MDAYQILAVFHLVFECFECVLYCSVLDLLFFFGETLCHDTFSIEVADTSFDVCRNKEKQTVFLTT